MSFDISYIDKALAVWEATKHRVGITQEIIDEGIRILKEGGVIKDEHSD